MWYYVILCYVMLRYNMLYLCYVYIIIRHCIVYTLYWCGVTRNAGVCLCVWENTPFRRTFALQSCRQNCSPAPDLVLCKPIFPRLLLWRSVFLNLALRCDVLDYDLWRCDMTCCDMMRYATCMYSHVSYCRFCYCCRRH